VVCHKCEGKGAGKGDGQGKRSGEEINYGDGEGSKDQRNDTKIPFWFCKGKKMMGENEEKGRMKEGWVLFIEF
jgi:hypothetical protein